MSTADGAAWRVDGAARRVLVVHCPDWAPGVTSPDPAVPPSRRRPPPPLGAAEFAQVVGLVEELCPQVEVVRPGICAIAARGPARYFGGEAALAGKIGEALGRRGIACWTGIADGLFAALLAAGAVRSGARLSGAALAAAGWSAAGPGGLRSDPGRTGLAGSGRPAGTIVPPGQTAAFLAAFPVSVLEVPELDHLLPRLGLTTLGEFAALPAAEAASRFGAQGALAHRAARGLDPRPLDLRPPAADLTAEREFDPPAGQSEPVVFAAKALADQLHAALAARGLACVRIAVQAICADGQEITRLWRHDGLLSALAVAQRVRWQLDGWRPGQAAPEEERADPDRAAALTGGVTLLRLIPDQVVRDHGRQLGLWGEAVVSDRVARAAVRVQAMLGHDAVTRPVLSGGRSPADQALLVPFGDAQPPPRPPDRPWPGQLPAPAPAVTCPAPLPAAVTDEGGRLVGVSARAEVSAPPARLSVAGGPPVAITSWAGPWPVTERWWDPSLARRRARFQLVTEDGGAWLAVLQDGQWLIEAGYD
ncbi:MAG: DNA polymerase Y family protein [Streptosporangiaceae bacterium]